MDPVVMLVILLILGGGAFYAYKKGLIGGGSSGGTSAASYSPPQVQDTPAGTARAAVSTYDDAGGDAGDDAGGDAGTAWEDDAGHTTLFDVDEDPLEKFHKVMVSYLPDKYHDKGILSDEDCAQAAIDAGSSIFTNNSVFGCRVAKQDDYDSHLSDAQRKNVCSFSKDNCTPANNCYLWKKVPSDSTTTSGTSLGQFAKIQRSYIHTNFDGKGLLSNEDCAKAAISAGSSLFSNHNTHGCRVAQKVNWDSDLANRAQFCNWDKDYCTEATDCNLWRKK